MARLKNWLCVSRARPVSANWVPLLFLALLWALAAWCHYNLPGLVLPMVWLLCALGSAAYLLTLVGFVFFGDRDRPVGASTRTATALAVGAAMIFAVYAWGKWPEGTNPTDAAPTSENAAKPDGNDSLDSINVFAAILGAMLAAVALIAQKSAVDARMEAERARKDILEALDIRVLALSSRMLERAQTAKAEAENFLDEAYGIMDQDQDMTRFLHLGAEGLKRLAKLFVLLHQWLLEPQLTLTDDLIGNMTILKFDLRALKQATQAGGPRLHDQEQRLRADYWRPAGRLIERLLEAPHGPPNPAVPQEAEKVWVILHEVRVILDRL